MQNAQQPFIELEYVIECWTISYWLHVSLRFKYSIEFKALSFKNSFQFHHRTADRLNCFTLDHKGLTDITARLFKIHESLGEVLKHVTSLVYLHFDISNQKKNTSICLTSIIFFLSFFFLQRIWINTFMFNDIKLFPNNDMRLFHRFGKSWKNCKRNFEKKKTITEPMISLTYSFQDAPFLISQIFWLLSHVIRIFVIVEPCHLVAFEVKTFKNDYEIDLQ